MISNPSQTTRIALLRAELERLGLDGFIIPRTDQYQGEYVPPSAERLAWLTGFTGSAGLAVVLREHAAIFTDGRYTIQVRSEVPEDLYDYRHLVNEPASDWITGQLESGQKLGFDPWLLTSNQYENFNRAAKLTGASLISVEHNPVDQVWSDQPAPPEGIIIAHEERFTGRSSEDKCREITGILKSSGQDCVFLSAPDSIAWLLNVRGSDLDRTPLPLSYAILHDNGQTDWFVSHAKLTNSLRQYLGDNVITSDPGTLDQALDKLGRSGKTVRLSAASTPYRVADRLKQAGAKTAFESDPCELPKARKTETELNGARAAHDRDGIAMIRFLAWLDGVSDNPEMTEIDVADYLEGLRREDDLFKGISFDTIAGTGPNGAICHYKVTDQSNRKLDQDSLLLVDSGGQYLDGTTDVTRTIPIGTPSDEMRDNFTRVLQGHIALAQARFPKGTTGSQLDPFARHALWRVGLDYDHGTGHGVGSYLNVHEGPQRISKAPNTVALEPGMIISNEPGYYKAGAYGIRIENLVAVCEHDSVYDDNTTVLGFETLTKAPIDLRLINPAMMEQFQLIWLNNYHAKVYKDLHNKLDNQTAQWLKNATRPIG